jgi:hypothetical protein
LRRLRPAGVAEEDNGGVDDVAELELAPVACVVVVVVGEAVEVDGLIDADVGVFADVDVYADVKMDVDVDVDADEDASMVVVVVEAGLVVVVVEAALVVVVVVVVEAGRGCVIWPGVNVLVILYFSTKFSCCLSMLM